MATPPLTKEAIIAALKDQQNKQEVENFAAYCMRIKTEIDKKTNNPKNPFMQYKTAQDLADSFKQVKNEGLIFDGDHITLQSTGISYDYIAYKNKMLLVYPESVVDIQLVYNGDDFSVQKDTGHVMYKHVIKNPFNQKDTDLVGGYCVIKNKRGEFLTTMSKDEITKHRNVAKTDMFWQKWFKEMVLKTIMKKACKMHFDDIFSSMEEEDKANFDLEKPINIETQWKQEVEEITTIDELKEYYLANKGRGSDFAKMIKQRKDELTESLKPNTNENA